MRLVAPSISPFSKNTELVHDEVGSLPNSHEAVLFPALLIGPAFPVVLVKVLGVWTVMVK